MAKYQGSLAEPVRERKTVDIKLLIFRLFEQLKSKIENIFFKRGLLLFIVGFLLARAFILSGLSPFSLPFFAAVFAIRKNKAPLVFIGLVGGALTLSIMDGLYTFGIISLFLVLNRIIKHFIFNEIKALHYIVFATMFIGRFIYYYIEIMDITLFNIIMTGVEASLAFVLTMIFLQSIPLFSISSRKQTLKTEEIVCLIILLASVITGTIGWSYEGIELANILSRYLVLIFAFTTGATVGATVGVVVGLVFGLANIESFPEMSLLAFGGLLGGLLKEGSKIGVSVGLIIATLLIGIYELGTASIVTSLYETFFASLLFFLTPRSFTNEIAKHTPGTPEFTAEQQAYMRKVRDVTANRVQHFSKVFTALAESFEQQQKRVVKMSEEELINDMLADVTKQTCMSCFKRENCWQYRTNRTLDKMTGIMTELLDNDLMISNRTERMWEQYCVKNKKVIDAMQREIYYRGVEERFNSQIQESRKIVANQLFGVSEVMKNFAEEIKKERDINEKQEEQILDAMQSIGIEVDHIEIYSLEKGNIDIDVTIPYCGGMGQCEKLIAPLLSSVLGETITVYREECGKYPNENCQATFRSAKRFVVNTGVAYAAKNGKLISGDSFTELEIDERSFAMAISDGMGNGERAYLESKETLSLLQKILLSGIDEEVAIKSINSILSLRTTDEVYATLDLAMIDLQNASTRFIKVGSAPSFIKRGNNVIKVEANNLPIGIIPEFEIDVVNEQLMAEDILILMSDGIYEGPKFIENKDIWLKRKIRELQTDNPQAIADILLEEVIRTNDGRIEDDMTVFVAKIKHNTPKWKTIEPISLRKLA
ncbi:stage II sporulation protein E [Pallidibacillus pasinlerensis]|uniref:Stage II sporulation protein E n=1 Tax=Pallidibacillus pasinlerensis TaxID=2703818 RepID=A0ABX0A2R7_9BACI|nr:stage II sporulation protein E [Pallidibacillus pasinlerensis]NCU17734.1 stage II sporulation protein E [Pallidibacillus pasinlerensis]